jgi:hypothetical protein
MPLDSAVATLPTPGPIHTFTNVGAVETCSRNLAIHRHYCEHTILPAHIILAVTGYGCL